MKNKATNVNQKQSPEHAVLLVAHGERGGRFNNARLVELANEVRANLASCGLGPIEVEAGVMKGDPSIKDAWDHLTAPNRLLYPFFMSDGYFCTKILPQKVRTAIGDTNLELTPLPPFGVSQRLADGIIAALLVELDHLGRKGEKAPVLIAAHGASVDKQSSRRAQELADALIASEHFGAVSCAFLDEAPYLEEVVPEIDPATLILPHFNGLGSHSVDDMAELATICPEGVHFVAPVGGQHWVADVISGDILHAFEHAELDIAAE